MNIPSEEDLLEYYGVTITSSDTTGEANFTVNTDDLELDGKVLTLNIITDVVGDSDYFKTFVATITYKRCSNVDFVESREVSEDQRVIILLD